MTRRFSRATAVIGLAGLALVLAAGCGTVPSPEFERRQMAIELADTLREESLRLPQDGQRERLVSGLIQLRELLAPESMLKPAADAPGTPVLPKPEGGAQPAPPWAVMFAPRSLVIGFFTRSRNFSGQGGDEGLEVRVQPLDQFGDPTKAVGQYRIEVFSYRLHSGEKRGERLGHWFIAALDAESNRRYYDPVDRSYVFPLLWDHEIEAGAPVIVQATYYPPGGFQDKLFAQRMIKIGEQPE